MLTYYILAVVLLVLVFRYIVLIKHKRKNLSEAEIDQHLHTLLNNERDSNEKKAGGPVQEKSENRTRL
ncbi:hypothetical protein NDK47_26320 [Brevibacillus ruminantium]|uniref:DUF4083 domain-containing protein n=1 Tax=Brevibacillus ruminantium TaxID=2950604 RepID=A0ABY4WHF4_9BACL|nr:hypothetical protein [Brevibacillus ruminantium]USG65573.1 hypothetical protein NDK47_26320 [Brevibacillus ruminantium]